MRLKRTKNYPVQVERAQCACDFLPFALTIFYAFFKVGLVRCKGADNTISSNTFDDDDDNAVIYVPKPFECYADKLVPETDSSGKFPRTTNVDSSTTLNATRNPQLRPRPSRVCMCYVQIFAICKYVRGVIKNYDDCLPTHVYSLNGWEKSLHI